MFIVAYIRTLIFSCSIDITLLSHICIPYLFANIIINYLLLMHVIHAVAQCAI